MTTENPFKLTQVMADALRDEYGRGATDAQWLIFLDFAERRRLLPGKDIHFTVHSSWEWNPETRSKQRVNKAAYITAIGSLQLLAERSEKYKGRKPTVYVYLDDKNMPTIESSRPLPPPFKFWGAEVTVMREGRPETTMFARYDAYVVTYVKDEVEYTGNMWKKRGPEQTAKCAFAGALREAFPEDLGGLYSEEELGRAGVESSQVERETAAPTDADPMHLPTVASPAVSTAPAVEHTSKPMPVIVTDFASSKTALGLQPTVVAYDPTPTMQDNAKSLADAACAAHQADLAKAAAREAAKTAKPIDTVPAAASQPAAPVPEAAVPEAVPEVVPEVAKPEPVMPPRAVIPVAGDAVTEAMTLPTAGPVDPLPSQEQLNGFYANLTDLIVTLTEHGLKSGKGNTASSKLKKYVLTHTTGGRELSAITLAQWEKVMLNMNAKAKTEPVVLVTELETKK